MSTLHTDVARLPKLMEEAAAALEIEEFVQRLKTAEGLPQPHELDAVARSRGRTAPLSRTTSVRTTSTTAIPVKARRTLKSRRS
jgi:hypothetical protein